MKSVSALGLLVAIGIVFGDIGTSPLYVMKTILSLSDNTDPEFIIATVSCVIWTLTLQTTLKYVLIALRADNKGEGGYHPKKLSDLTHPRWTRKQFRL